MTELRPLRVEDLGLVTAWKSDADYGGDFQWFGFGSSRGMRDAVVNDSVIDNDGGSLAVVDGDVLCGDVSWRRVSTGPSLDSACFNIGILICPDQRGKGHGTAAQRLLADYLFAHFTLQRVEASTDVDNLAEQRSLEKAGYTREGVLRGFQWRQGAWRDMVIYSKLRGEK
jgi:RimJ/RimL family protein N-acetyltransferase